MPQTRGNPFKLYTSPARDHGALFTMGFGEGENRLVLPRNVASPGLNSGLVTYLGLESACQLPKSLSSPGYWLRSPATSRLVPTFARILHRPRITMRFGTPGRRRVIVSEESTRGTTPGNRRTGDRSWSGRRRFLKRRARTWSLPPT